MTGLRRLIHLGEPVMPTMRHEFSIRPFHFCDKNPVLDLPKSLADD